MQLVQAESPEHWHLARRLVLEYADSLGIDLEFQRFSDEIANLERMYAPPRGAFLLALGEGAALGCVALRPESDDSCEMKRLYVVPVARGQGVGQALATAIIERARHLGFRRMLLDTLPTMQAAQKMYRGLGFAPTPPYRENPVPGTSFLALELE